MSIEIEVAKPTPVQQRVIAALVQGSTISAAARAAGLHRTTVHYWCRTQPHFRLALEQAKQIHADFVRDELRALSRTAMDVLKRMITNPNYSGAVRLRAILAVIQASMAAEVGPLTDPLIPQAHLDAICTQLGESGLRSSLPKPGFHHVASASSHRESQCA